MGRQSSLKALNREIADLQRQKMLAQLLAEKMSDPAFQEHIAAIATDEVLHARWQADLPDQARRLKAAGWARAFEGEDGIGGWAHPVRRLQMIHSLTREADGGLWAHMSLAFHRSDDLPGWEALRDAHWLLYPDMPAVQVVAPRSRHVNIAEVAHLWTRLDAPAVPDFGRFGTI
jgi:hypothetical protein